MYEHNAAVFAYFDSRTPRQVPLLSDRYLRLSWAQTGPNWTLFFFFFFLFLFPPLNLRLSSFNEPVLMIASDC